MLENIENDIIETIGKDQSIQVIKNEDVVFENPLADVFVAKTLISNACWINTSEGTVVIDTLLNRNVAFAMKRKIAETGGLVKYIIYTHHHLDHVGGSTVFKDDNPKVLAHRYLPENLEKYNLLKQHRAKIASAQFNVPYDPERIPSIINPTILFDGSYSFAFGDKTFELNHCRAETEDAVWVFVPEIKTAIIGDLIIIGFPNIGNPFKPTRFALSWARALEKIRSKKPELLVANAVYQGEEINELLDMTIEGIYAIHDQVVDYINEGVPIHEMIHRVKLPNHLRNNPCLQFIYSRPEFAVFNIYRWYHGYYDLNPANLLPRPDREINREIYNLIGDKNDILKRSKELFEKGQPQLALQVLDIMFKMEPEDLEMRKLHLSILQKCCEEDYCLMSRNSWVYAIEKDKDFLKSRGESIN